jgi:hypothetical protein
MKFLHIKNLRELIEKPQKIIESDIKEYLVYLRKERKISYVTANTYLVPIRKFYYVNSDYQFKWDFPSSCITCIKIPLSGSISSACSIPWLPHIRHSVYL